MKHKSTSDRLADLPGHNSPAPLLQKRQGDNQKCVCACVCANVLLLSSSSSLLLVVVWLLVLLLSLLLLLLFLLLMLLLLPLDLVSARPTGRPKDSNFSQQHFCSQVIWPSSQPVRAAH
jgi:hypothetical protein